MANVLGTGGNDTLNGTSADDSIDGGAGNDRIDALEGSDSVQGEAGNDTLFGRGGSDSLRGGDGADELYGGSGNDVLDGGAGVDYARFNEATAGANINLAAGTATDGLGGTDSLVAIENIGGTLFADAIIGDANANTLFGSDGNDSLSGGEGDDFLNGETGNDSLVGGGGNDQLNGHEGNDTLDGGAGHDFANYLSTTTGIVVNLSLGTASDGLGGTDVLVGIESVFASPLNDTLAGDANANALLGNGGHDAISGGSGNDTLSGQAGNDTVDGGAGVDLATFVGVRSNFTVVTTGPFAFTVSGGAEGSDVLLGIERLQFSNAKIAFDLAGNAGNAALLVGALMGKDGLKSVSTVGSVLALLDGGQSLADLCALAVSAGVTIALAGGSGNDLFATLLVRNLLGVADPSTIGLVQGLLDSGAFTQASLLATACTLEINKSNIDLVGLTQIGLVYGP